MVFVFKRQKFDEIISLEMTVFIGIVTLEDFEFKRCDIASFESHDQIGVILHLIGSTL
jgi:hypothetical protein